MNYNITVVATNRLGSSYSDPVDVDVVYIGEFPLLWPFSTLCFLCFYHSPTIIDIYCTLTHLLHISLGSVCDVLTNDVIFKKSVLHYINLSLFFLWLILMLKHKS